MYEIHAGVFLLDELPAIDNACAVRRLLGAGDDITILRAAGNFPVIEMVGISGLVKAGAVLEKAYEGVTLEGGSDGIRISCYGGGCLTPGGGVYDCTFRNLSNTGITYTTKGHEFDQVKIYNTRFHDIGNHGIYLQRSMIDTQGYLACEFKNIGKPGVITERSMMFAGTIYECRCENIDGPGVDFYPRFASTGGNPPHCSMINRCESVNCGTSSRAALDWGFTDNGAVVNCKVRITDGRTVKYGIAGTRPYFDRCSVFVDNGSVSAASFGLRQTRLLRNARPMGSIVNRCYSNRGDMAFAYNDVPGLNDNGRHLALQALFAGSNHEGMKWWQASDPSSRYPWACSHAIYGSQFGTNTIDYSLNRLDKSGQVLDQVALSPEGGSGPRPRVRGMTKPAHRSPLCVYRDLTGRRVATVKDIAPRSRANEVPGRRVYLARDQQSGRRVRVSMMP